MRIVAPTHFQTPNDLVDHWLPKLGEAEVKVLLVVFRKTFGWHKEKDQISLSQFQTLTGLTRTNTCNALKSLIDKGILQKEIVGILGNERVFYSLVIEDSNNSNQSCSDTPPSPVPIPPLVPEKDPQNKRTKDISKEQQHAAVFFECLKDIDIPIKDKQWISKKYSEDIVENAIKWAQHPSTEIKKELSAALKWACEAKPKIPKDKKEISEDNKIWAEEIADFCNGKNGYTLMTNTTRLDIYKDNFSKSWNYTEKKFKETVMDELIKRNIMKKDRK